MTEIRFTHVSKQQKTYLVLYYDQKNWQGMNKFQVKNYDIDSR